MSDIIIVTEYNSQKSKVNQSDKGVVTKDGQQTRQVHIHNDSHDTQVYYLYSTNCE